MAKQIVGGGKVESSKRKRPGVHSKKRTQRGKQSRNYKKKYRGQGR